MHHSKIIVGLSLADSGSETSALCWTREPLDAKVKSSGTSATPHVQKIGESDNVSFILAFVGARVGEIDSVNGISVLEFFAPFSYRGYIFNLVEIFFVGRGCVVGYLGADIRIFGIFGNAKTTVRRISRHFSLGGSLR